MGRNARIVATAMHAPDRVVPNRWFDERLGEDGRDGNRIRRESGHRGL